MAPLSLEPHFLVGTDVRKLVYDGYTAQNVYGCDLYQSYLDHGHDLYRDRTTCAITFFSDDVFELPYPPPPTKPLPAKVTSLSQLVGRVSHIYTGELFHLFNEEQQYQLALRLGSLVKRAPGAVVYGRHWANPAESKTTQL